MLKKNRNCIIFFFGCILFLNITGLHSQNRITDSLVLVLKKLNANAANPSLKDTSRVFILNELSARYLKNRDFSTAIKYARIAQNISEKMVKVSGDSKAKICLANSFKSVANIYGEMEEYPNALKEQKKELILREEIGDKTALALCLNSIGITYHSQEDFAQSLEYYFKALKTMEEAPDKKGITRIYNSLGVAYARQNNPAKALEYYIKELKEGEVSNDLNAIARAHINIGNLYADDGNYEGALKEFSQFLKVAEHQKDKYSIALAYLNIGDIFTRKNDYGQALEMNNKSIKLFEELGSKSDLALSYYNQGEIYLSLLRADIGDKKNNISEARKNLNKSLSLFEKIGQIDGMGYCFETLSSIDSITGNLKSALENYKKHIRFKDSLINQENTAKSVRAEMNYEFGKKEAVENLAQEKKNALAKQENQRQKAIRNLFIVAFAFMLILAIFIFKSYHQKKLVNRVISQQKIEVEEQKFIVEKNQKQIIDSINYAKRIQGSMLPNHAILKKAFNDFFIFYQPKDIVSGDFYWFYSIPGTSEVIIVLADCTGHGVPGAFLSMVGTTLLNEIVGHKNISDPADIIKSLNRGLTSTLATKKEETHSDGMDISICKIDTHSKKLLYAGANQTLYIVEQDSIEKLEPQVNSIDGVFDLAGSDNFHSVEKYVIPGSIIYMSSDGYADQTGEASRKKFRSSRFEELLSELHSFPLNEQRTKIDNVFNSWKGNQKQIDDILVIGFKS